MATVINMAKIKAHQSKISETEIDNLIMNVDNFDNSCGIDYSWNPKTNELRIHAEGDHSHTHDALDNDVKYQATALGFDWSNIGYENYTGDGDWQKFTHIYKIQRSEKKYGEILVDYDVRLWFDNYNDWATLIEYRYEGKAKTYAEALKMENEWLLETHLRYDEPEKKGDCAAAC